MSVTDHYPRKKSRPCLSAKRSTTKKKDVIVMHTQNNTPPLSKDIPLPLKNQLNLSSSCHHVSSDESCVEIGWDNNSPSPTKVLPSGNLRKRSKHKAPDITKLLKIIPKKKKLSETTETLDNDVLLSTWMRENLATNTTASNISNRRSVIKRSLKNQGVLDFSEQLKKFVEMSTLIPEHCFQKKTTGRRSPRLLTKKLKENFPPKLINYSPSDSLLLMENFDELLIDDRERNQCDEVTTHVKTPKTKRTKTLGTRGDLIFKPSSPEMKIDNITADDQHSGKERKHVKDTLRSCTNSIAKMNGEMCGRQDNELIDLTLEDDSIGNLSLPDSSFTKVKCTESNDNRAKKLTAKRKYMSTPKLVKTETGLVAFDDDFLFDEMLMDLDEEFKCKSQETPPRITANQRKLKTRSHTSPFPLNKRCKRTVTPTGSSQNDALVVQTTKELKINNNGFIPIPSRSTNIPENTQLKTARTSFVSNNIASDRCKRPFIPPRKGEFTTTYIQDEASSVKLNSVVCNVSRKKSYPLFPLDLSVIKGESKGCTIGDSDQPMFLHTRSVNPNELPPISSTQKCNFEEIERKRREAQHRLRQRSLRK